LGRLATRKASSAATIAVCFALFFGTWALFGRALGNGFINYDDPAYVAANAFVQRGLSWAGVRWALTANVASNWHPLTLIVHEADWSLFQGRPGGHHASSVTWHALNAVMVFLVFRRLTGAFWTSAFCAALFAWHPLRVESVAWVSELKDVLSGFFALLTLWAYAAYSENRGKNRARARFQYALALLAFALGLMAKPMLVTLPGVMLLLDFWPLGRRIGTAGVWIEKIPFFSLSVASAAVTYLYQKGGGAVALELPLGARLANAAVSVPRYLGKCLWPFDLAPVYPLPDSWPAAAVCASVALTAAITIVAVIQIRRRPWLLTGWLWFLGMMIPVSGVIQVGVQSMADRYSYLPILGLQLAVLWTIRDWAAAGSPGKDGIRAIGFASAAVLAAMAARTWSQIGNWRDSGRLWGHALAVTKDNFVAFNNLGTFLEDRGEIDKAVIDFRSALGISPDYADANINLGHALAWTGFPAEAIGYCRRALEIEPESAQAHLALGEALMNAHQLEAAAHEYERALSKKPELEEALKDYGLALAMEGRMDEAVIKIQAALRLNPDDDSAHGNLGIIYTVMGRLDDAISEDRKALAISPNVAAGHFNLGKLLEREGRLTEATREFQTALQLDPGLEQARDWLRANGAARTK
jgi:tetratricopeptide (TPR) repeat protein